ncbi:MAG: DNA polymerase III subunit alpha [Proteobacteria bacterium]|nr:DNA polymerase III subunit alpha [Pseudomonadota bacterium]
MTENTPDFAHLHVHTQYSLLDGAIRLDKLFKRAKEYNMSSVAITDHGTMFGVLEFYEYATKAGIRPILGCEAYMAPRRMSDKSTPQDGTGLYHLVLLAQNNIGYKNLCKLATLSQLEGFYYKPRLDKEIIQSHSEGIIALSACLAGEIPRLIGRGKLEEADEVARFYQGVFGENNFYLEVQDNGIPEQNFANDVIYDMSNRLSIPLVATNDCHYLDKADVRAHEILLCVQTGNTINDPKRFKFSTDQLYFKSKEEMAASFSRHPEALSNTVDIANRCHVDFDFKTYHFPRFDDGSGKKPEEIFEDQARVGYKKRMAYLLAKHPDLDLKVYDERLDYEIKTIIKMGFPGYFLIVADFIRFGKENGIPIGPGRGSAAGSMVAYSMNITDLDPIEHGLIFERFLNPARISMPDIDVDFCINGRDKVFKYVSERYGGGDYVSQITTFGTMKTKAVIRDVGRALNIPLPEVDRIAKLVPDTLGIKLQGALDQVPELAALAESKEYGELISVCKVLEGLTRHASVHAAGVVVGDTRLVEYLPLYKGKNGEIVTQFDMKRVEKIGLVKFDFLGLRNLTVIDDALRLIKEQGKEPPDLLEQDFNDPATYKLLSSGDTTGVFQLESSGMKDLLVRLKPECFNDITALVALYRPGPLDSGMVDAYVERKHGREPVEYQLPEMEAIVKETYGVILYQEQVMRLASVLASYSMAEADGLRKAMGKKIAEDMAKHRSLFMNGSIANNHPEDKAKEIFDLMEKFGGYGFNKSHSAAYALICFQTAFLKAHYPVEFMAALLTSEMNSVDGVVKFIAECKSHDIKVLPPDVNESNKAFAVIKGDIRFGLIAVKNVGEGALDSIIETRKKDGPFSSIFEFCERVDLRKVNKRVVEALIKCGAFDSTGHGRSQMMAALEDALEHGQRVQREKNDRQLSLFGDSDGNDVSFNTPVLPDIPEWDDKYRLSLEKESLGFYISGHPLDRYATVLEKFTNVNGLTIHELEENQAVRMGGIITANKTIRTKKGDQMAFVTLEDMYGGVEVVVFPSIFEECSDFFMDDSALIVEGEAQKKEKGLSLIAEKVVLLERAEEEWTANLQLTLGTDPEDKDMPAKVLEVLKRYPGSCKVYVRMVIPGKTETVIELPDKSRVNVCTELLRELKALLGRRAVNTVCKPAAIAPKKNGHKQYLKRVK